MKSTAITLLVLLYSILLVRGFAQSELQGLKALQLAWRPSGWTGKPSCSWSGISCNLNGNIIQLALSGINGSIPDQISQFTFLQHLTLANNQLTGIIPSSLSRLTNLQTLDLSSNQLTGQFPDLGSLSLQVLAISNNQLSGTIPASIAGLGSLQFLVANNNALSGSIPSFTDTILEVILSLNSLTGTIPSNFFSSASIARLDLHSNQLSGSLTPEVESNFQPSYLYIQNNELQGDVPVWICNIANYDLRNNTFNCATPACCSPQGNGLCTCN